MGEILLWKKLRAGSMRQYAFNRQKPLGRYIVDFYCKPLNLVIEIDGAYHFEPEQRLKDIKRQQLLEQMGLRFLRFTEQEVRKDMDMVLLMISRFIDECEQLSGLTPIADKTKLSLTAKKSNKTGLEAGDIINTETWDCYSANKS